MNRIKDYGKLATDITAWIKNYAESNNITSLVIGVSGGIDSAVVSTLCAMTGLSTYCCSLPIQTSDSHLQLATRHILWLRGKYPDTVFDVYRDLSNSYITLRLLLPNGTELVDANTKSRLRMTTLYHIAGCANGIVVGTGNRVEDFGIGFYTKYGDGGVDISPIADLYKTEVRELGRYLGISEEILTAAPTDGLFADGRTDEQQIGCTYEDLEWAMDTREKGSFTIGEFDPRAKAIDIYATLNKKNQHKMLPIPIFKLNQ